MILKHCQGLKHDNRVKRETAFCPYCAVDALPGNKTGYPLADRFPSNIEGHWFGDRNQAGLTVEEFKAQNHWPRVMFAK